MVKYVYDAWGNHKVLDASGNEITDPSHIGNRNPFRYRSYYYDTETGLYYLKARYYDPEVGRFISADDLAYVDPDHVNGTNLYVYCYNNPVMNVDPEGTFVMTCLLVGLIAGAIIGAVIGGVVAYDIAKETGATGWELAGWTALGVFGGAIVGGALGAVAGATVGELIYGVAALGSAIGGGSLMALIEGGVMGGGAALAGASASTIVTAGVATGALGLGVIYMAKPNSGRIRYQDRRIGIDPETGEPVTDKDRAYEIYHNLNDPAVKAKWKRWMKGKGWRTSHLKGLIFLPLLGEWFRRMFTGEW